MPATLSITQVKSPSGANPAQRDSLRTLGLGRIGKKTEREDTPIVRGLINRVSHLVEVRDA